MMEKNLKDETIFMHQYTNETCFHIHTYSTNYKNVCTVTSRYYLLPTQQAEIESPIYCGAVGPALLMRTNLNEHPACYLCLRQAVSGFTLRKYCITTGAID